MGRCNLIGEQLNNAWNWVNMATDTGAATSSPVGASRGNQGEFNRLARSEILGVSRESSLLGNILGWYPIWAHSLSVVSL